MNQTEGGLRRYTDDKSKGERTFYKHIIPVTLKVKFQIYMSSDKPYDFSENQHKLDL